MTTLGLVFAGSIDEFLAAVPFDGDTYKDHEKRRGPIQDAVLLEIQKLENDKLIQLGGRCEVYCTGDEQKGDLYHLLNECSRAPVEETIIVRVDVRTNGSTEKTEKVIAEMDKVGLRLEYCDMKSIYK